MANIETLLAGTRYYAEVAAPGTPAAGSYVTYAKADGLMYQKDDAGTETAMGPGAGGSVSTDPIWVAAGDLAVGSGANTAARLAIGATNGMILTRVGGAVAWAFPPGYEYAYAQFTSTVSVTATTEGTANTVVTAAGVAFDGSTIVLVRFFSELVSPASDAAGRTLSVYLYDDTGGGAASIGRIGMFRTPATGLDNKPAVCELRLTPTAATHTYSIRAAVSAITGTIAGGTGGLAGTAPGFIQILKV